MSCPEMGVFILIPEILAQGQFHRRVLFHPYFLSQVAKRAIQLVARELGFFLTEIAGHKFIA